MGVLSALAGPVIGGITGLFGAKQSAKLSQKQAREQMAFQERLSNTAFQRAASDLEAAGLNRILALGSPASSPGGAMGQVPDFGQAMISGAQMADGLRTSAGQRRLMTAQGQNQVASARAANEQADYNKANARFRGAQADTWETFNKYIKKSDEGIEMLLKNIFGHGADADTRANAKDGSITDWMLDRILEFEKWRYQEQRHQDIYNQDGPPTWWDDIREDGTYRREIRQ